MRQLILEHHARTILFQNASALCGFGRCFNDDRAAADARNQYTLTADASIQNVGGLFLRAVGKQSDRSRGETTDRGLFAFVFRFAAEDRDDVFDGDDKELIVGLEIDRNGVLGVEEDFVVLPERNVFVVFDLSRDGDDAASDRGYLGGVRQGDAALGLPLGLVLADQDASTDRLD